VALVTFNSVCGACSWAVGYFHQVTAVRGRIVGKNLGLVGFRWLRQSFSVAGATLTLYEYRSPAKIKDLKKIAVIEADSHGDFDFGSIPKGHYSLDISVKDSDRMGGWFDIEVTDAVKATRNVTIDVSPITPDCRGGHEFIETKF
jgi:hypothetical protein